MAHLLLMFQYMRAKREYNQLTAKQFSNQSKKTRIKKNIEKTQKYYTDAKAKIASQAKLMQSNATNIFQQMSGISTQMVNGYLNPMAGGSINAWATQAVYNGVKKGKIQYGDEKSPKTMSENQFNAIQQLISSTPGASYSNLDYDALLKDENTKNILTKGGITSKDDLSALTYAYQQAMTAANCEYNNRSMWVQQANANFAQNVSIWEEAMNAELEYQQDMAIEPLNYEETMMELEETTIKTQLEEKKEEMNTLKQELAERVKEDVPKFGLS